MTRSAATQIAGYLTTGFYRDMGYAAPPFDRQAGDGLTVWMDLSDRADRGIVRLALDAWSTVTGLRFALDGRAGDHDLRFTDAGRGAYSYSTHARDGERLSAVVNMGQDWLDAYGGGAVSYYTQSWIHEIGHALGLGHAGPYDSQASWGDQRFGLDSWQMSVMSYFSPAENPNVSASRGYVLTPMPADIIAIQDLYGAPDDRGADVYGFGGTAGGIYARFGEMLDRGQMSVPILLTIWDGGGRDMLNLSRDSHDQRIDLRPGAFSDVLGWKGTLGIAYGTAIEDARGGRGADWVIGNGTANRIWGHQGDDQLRGGRMDAREGLKFLESQIADREKALREVEARRAAFEASNIGLVGGGAGSPAQRVDAMRSEINQIDSQLVAAQASLAAANGQLAQTPATINVPGAPATGAGVARQQLAGAQNELSQMRARGLTDAHPDVIAIKSQIAALKAQADREGTGGGGGNAQNPAYASLAAMRAERQATVSALTARKAQLTGDIAKITSQQIQNPGVAAEYDRINGEYTALKAQYDKLLAQREQVRLRGQVQTETDAIKVELLDPPSKPTSPSAPNRPLFLTAVLLAGIAGGIGVAFGLAQVRTSYPTAARLERASGLPVIGSITEVVTPDRHVERRKRLVWLASGAGALVALYALLLVAEFVQRGLVA